MRNTESMKDKSQDKTTTNQKTSNQKKGKNKISYAERFWK